MIDCICINDKKRPAQIPESKWIRENDQYRITWVSFCLPQKVFAFSLYEKPLDESCKPYEYFIAERFAIRKEHLSDLIELCEACAGITPLDALEALENSKLEVL